MVNGDQKWFQDQIRAGQDSIALMTEIREGTDDWEIEELTREIIFEEMEFIQRMREGAEYAAGKEPQTI
jgi:hypothetical protein